MAEEDMLDNMTGEPDVDKNPNVTSQTVPVEKNDTPTFSLSQASLEDEELKIAGGATQQDHKKWIDVLS